MFGIIAVSLSLLVILAGLALLAKSKKEELGKLYTVSAYIAIFTGLGLFIGGNVGGMHRLGHAMKGHCGMYSKCGPSSCGSAMSMCGSHAMMNTRCGHASYGHGMCASGGHGKCMSGGYGMCGSGGHCGGSHGHGHVEGHGHHGKKMHKKFHHKGDDENIKIEIEVEEDDDDE